MRQTKQDLKDRNSHLERENNLIRELLMAMIRKETPDYQTQVELHCDCPIVAGSCCGQSPLVFTITLYRSTRAHGGIVLETSIYNPGHVPNVNVVYADDWLAHYKSLITRLGGQWHAFAKPVYELETARTKALDLHYGMVSA